MNRLIYILPLFFFFFFFGCSGSDDESTGIDYRLSAEDIEISITDNGRNASINVPGLKTDYTLYISGDFVNIVFDADVDWLSAEYYLGEISIHTSAIDNSIADSRTGRVNFTVFNDTKSASGYISLTQRAVTAEDLREYEDKAINFFLDKQQVIKEVPSDNDIIVDDNAPFYLLSANPIVAMKVIDKGSEDKPADNDRVYFRFSRANLMTFYQTGEICEHQVDINSACSFRFNDFTSSASAQWGKAIQMPLIFGLGYNAKVQLVVASPFGLKSEVSGFTPFLYTIQYYKGEGNEHEEIPPSLVNIPFTTEAEWTSFIPTDVLSWQYFNRQKNLPGAYVYSNESATGFGGVIIVTDVTGMQNAYDAACPVECSNDVILSIDNENLNAYCPECGSRYDIFGNYGIPLSGKAEELHCALCRYNIVSTDAFYKLITN